jgi:hypothetical protein
VTRDLVFPGVLAGSLLLPGWAGIRPSGEEATWFNALRSYTPEAWLVLAIAFAAFLWAALAQRNYRHDAKNLRVLAALATLVILAIAFINGPSGLFDPRLLVGEPPGTFDIIRGPLLFGAIALAVAWVIASVADRRKRRTSPPVGNAS